MILYFKFAMTLVILCVVAAYILGLMYWFDDRDRYGDWLQELAIKIALFAVVILVSTLIVAIWS
jgi:uncharacterized membrane protein YdjX (TVP38/TMEM64 family)